MKTAIFRVLGTIEIGSPEQTARLRGSMQQTLLATFLAGGEKLITVDSLAEELWGPTPPAKAENALQAQVSRLRHTLTYLEPERRVSRLTTSVSGYEFNVDWSEFDAWTFLHTIDRIFAEIGESLQQDISDLRGALALWRGPVFGGLVGGAVCRTAAARYRESHTTALELLYDLELKTGGHTRIVPELTEIVAQNPLQEQFCSLLMVALYRSGRQIDALNVYRRLRRSLDEDLGIEPSPVLRRYEKGILNHDPLLLRAQPDVFAPTPRVAVLAWRREPAAPQSI